MNTPTTMAPMMTPQTKASMGPAFYIGEGA